MVGMVSSYRKRYGKITTIHMWLEILAGEEDTEKLPGANGRREPAEEWIVFRLVLRRENRIENDLGFGRDNEIVFLVYEREEQLESVRRESGPKIDEVHANLRLHWMNLEMG